MKKFTCKCGKKVLSLRYKNGNKICDFCTSPNLSGTFMRRMDMDRQTYAKDILQPYNKDGTKNKDYIESYGTKIYDKNNRN